MPRRNTFTIELSSPTDPGTTMQAVLDLDAHQRLIPLTTLQWSGPLRAGSTFVARTGLGRLAVDDEMVITEHLAATPTKAGRCRIRKTGRVIGGDIELAVHPADHGSRVLWHQRIGVRGLPAAFDPLVTVVARAAYRHILKRLVARRR